MSKIDLHIHSHFSLDGEFSVNDILSLCEKSDMELVSITDHNSIKSVSEIPKNNKGICVISGVELDCSYKGKNLHLLGYGFDPALADFAKIGDNIKKQEKEAAVEKIRLFQNATGIPVDSSAIIAASKDGIVTGESIGEYVLSKENAKEYKMLTPYLPGGGKSDMPNVHFYWDFFAPGKPAEVPINYISLAEGIGLIHKAKGIVVLAHPGQSLSSGYDVLNGIIAEGIDGIEVFSSYHSPEEAAYFLDIAKLNRLLISCGSDFHGKNKPTIHIGDHGAVLSDEELIKSLQTLMHR